MDLPLPVEPGAAQIRAAAAELAERLPAPLQPLAHLAYNYRWSWDPDGAAIYAAIDPERWEAVGGNPVRLLVEASPRVRDRAAADDGLVERIDRRTAGWSRTSVGPRRVRWTRPTRWRSCARSTGCTGHCPCTPVGWACWPATS
jgi:hypothetical protein